MCRRAGSGHQANEWRMTGDDSGHESIVELAAIVTSHADACASSAAIPCMVGE